MPSRVDTQRDLKFGNFDNAEASDLRPAKQPISEGDMGDAAGLEDEDVGAVKKLNFESHCVYKLGAHTLCLV